MFVGISGGRFLSHRHVAFVSPWPNCQGWIIWSGFRYLVDMMPMGFSSAMRGMFALASAKKKAMDFCCVPLARLAGNQRAPLTAKSVQGGKAIIMSQVPTGEVSG